MSDSTPEIKMPVQLSDAACRRVRTLIAGEGKDNLKLRVYIIGGGCSGFQYGFGFEEDANDADTIVTKDDISLLVDPISVQYLQGATVDFSEDLMGARFVVDNPNAKTTCGCGASFSV